MAQRDLDRWIWPPADQWLAWGYFVLVASAVAASHVLAFFSRLSGTAWLVCYFLAVALAVVGSALILHAKLPLYRRRQFFTFGSRALPANRRLFYRRGYCCAALAFTLLLCLILTTPS